QKLRQTITGTSPVKPRWRPDLNQMASLKPGAIHKQPNLFGSVKQSFGDNIYHRDATGIWQQVDSHHSFEDGAPNSRNIINDTKSQNVLVGRRFAYWGSSAFKIPDQFLGSNGHTICLQRGYKSNFPPEFVQAFVSWFESLGIQGLIGPPFMWR
ncbi:MAG: hypothetical protein B7Y06_13140, partial [Burkholderiales bacterium 24-55-52]